MSPEKEWDFSINAHTLIAIVIAIVISLCYLLIAWVYIDICCCISIGCVV